ncbi:MAG: glutaminase A [Myxococcota bacterium]
MKVNDLKSSSAASGSIFSNADLREKRLFRALDVSSDGTIYRRDLEAALEEAGIRMDDPRVSLTMDSLRRYEREQAAQGSRRLGGVPGDVFAEAVRHNILLIERALQGNLMIPDFRQFCAEIEALYGQCIECRSGASADYIPQLRLPEPEVDQFGVSLCTVDGQRYSVGDSQVFFTAQSTCKPINYCLALEEHGADEVHRFIGREPSGASFNEIKLNAQNKPHNPLINAGAIMACSLIRLSERRKRIDEGRDLRGWAGKRFDYVLGRWKALAGGTAPRFSNSVYLSERETADRNFALGHFMREKRAFPKDSDLFEVLEFYFQCCSMEVTTEILATVAATLANGGICPVTGERVFSTTTVQHCLSLMNSCGMYDFSGEFAFTIGLPAKSGVSGGLWVVVPNVMGLCCWSPRLDEIGNSVRGIKFCQGLVKRFNFHNYDILAGTAGKTDPRVSSIQAESRHVHSLIWAASKGDVSAIQRQVTLGADVNVSDYDGRTPLHLAAAEGRATMVAFFLKLKERGIHVDLNVHDRWGGTPLDDAITHVRSDVVELLRAAGAAEGTRPCQTDLAPPTDNAAVTTDPDLVVELIWAAAVGDLRAMLRLVARGVPLDCADYDFRTPLHLAAAEGHLDIVRYLVSNGANLNARDRWGTIPADDAKRHGRHAVVEMLSSEAAR